MAGTMTNGRLEKLLPWWFAVLFIAGCVTVSQRFIDPRPWLKRGRIESAEAPRHPRLDAPMGVGPDPALGCVPAGSAREEELLERALQHMLELPGATNCTDAGSSSELHAQEYCGAGYSYGDMFCTTIPMSKTSINSARECEIPGGGVIHLEPGQERIDLDALASAPLLARGFPLTRYLIHTHPCVRTFLSQLDVTAGLIVLKFKEQDQQGRRLYAPSVIRYAASPTGELDLARPLEGWLRTPDREFKINLVSGEVWRKKVPRSLSGAGIAWQRIGKCVVDQKMLHADQQCRYDVDPLR